MKQNESWRVKSERVQVMPKAEDAEHSLSEQEAERRQQSRMPVKTTCVRSASGLSCSELNKPSGIAGNHLKHTYVCQVKNGITKKREKSLSSLEPISLSAGLHALKGKMLLDDW